MNSTTVRPAVKVNTLMPPEAQVNRPSIAPVSRPAPKKIKSPENVVSEPKTLANRPPTARPPVKVNTLTAGVDNRRQPAATAQVPRLGTAQLIATINSNHSHEKMKTAVWNSWRIAAAMEAVHVIGLLVLFVLYHGIFPYLMITASFLLRIGFAYGSWEENLDSSDNKMVESTLRKVKIMRTLRPAVVMSDIALVSVMILSEGMETSWIICLVVDILLLISSIILSIYLHIRYRKHVRTLATFNKSKNGVAMRTGLATGRVEIIETQEL